MGSKAHSAIMFFNSVTRAMGTNAVAEFLRRVHHRKTVFQGSDSHSLVSGESRCATPYAWRPELISMQRMLMQFKQRVFEVADEVTMVASRADELSHGVQLD